MKQALIQITLAALSSVAFAGNQNLCRDKLLSLLSVEPSQFQNTLTKTLVGKVDRSTYSYGLVKSGPCQFKIEVYQPGTIPAAVYAEDSLYEFDPFNHSVGADNDPETCSGSGSQSVRGYSQFTQDSGWHHSFSTTFVLTKNQDSTVTLDYSANNDRVACTGLVQ